MDTSFPLGVGHGDTPRWASVIKKPPLLHAPEEEGSLAASASLPMQPARELGGSPAPSRHVLTPGPHSPRV